MLKKYFPFFTHHPDIAYLDNAATTHKPQIVIDAMTNFYEKEYATVGRSIYSFSEKATDRVQKVREKVAQFIGAQAHEIIFTKGATEGINMIAMSWARSQLKAGDEIVLTDMEHHSNLLPWMQVAKDTGAVIRYIPVTETGTLDYDAAIKLLSKKTKLVALTMVSNAIGIVNNVSFIASKAHAHGAQVMVDASQAVGHMPVHVDALGANFMVFSGHKMYGPTGIGILYIKDSIHAAMAPYQTGGGMVFEADYAGAEFLKVPHLFEAGTPPIAQIIGLGAAIDFINEHMDLADVEKYEAALTAQCIEGLAAIKQVRLLGPLEQLKKDGHLVSFTVEGIHPHDVGAYLDSQGVLVRAGHFCAQPLAKKLGIIGAIRASFGVYTTPEDISRCLKLLQELLNS